MFGFGSGIPRTQPRSWRVPTLLTMPDEVTIIGGGPCGSLLAVSATGYDLFRFFHPTTHATPCSSSSSQLMLTRRGYDVTVFELRDEASIKMEPVETEASLAGGVDKLKNASARSINLALSHRGEEATLRRARLPYV